MSTRERQLEYEAELELEGEGEGESELEAEEEAILSSRFRGARGTLGGGSGEFESEWELEGEYELEGEWEGEFESEWELEGEYELEGEWEGEFESEWELEGEYEYEGEWEGEFESEEFIRRALRRVAPIARRLAPHAAQIVGTAVAGPAGGLVARRLAQALSEAESEGELEGELEATPARSRAVAEMMAAAATRAHTQAEAEAYVGAATIQVLTARDRRALLELLPHLVHGMAALTRILHRRRDTRQVIRTVPHIVGGTARTLSRRASAGLPVNRRIAGQVMAQQTRRVLANPRVISNVAARNVRATRTVARPAAATRAAGTGLRRPPSGVRRPPPGVVVARTPSGRLVPARVVPLSGARVVPRATAGARGVPRRI
ncbi:hypothetical protein CcI49_22460 [Frankia sp. CcI49]|uniref:hypothetical protein n=1 Tax=Frankia sp. CcI49 TaxID=1745382 RepID=UPI0009788B16|nr:hypothetical protein [Frankia sp. CcI49]ONH58251.1 hypothetical protein CcI49_22460 [Frankia sp. CcI49]